MSADNMIYVQKRGKHWRVWMGFASDEREPKPSKRDSAHLDTRKEAMAYAHGYERGLGIVEYGIIELPSFRDKKKNARTI